MYEGQFAKLESMVHTIDSFDWVPEGNRGGGKILQAASIVYKVKGDPKGEEFRIPGFLVAVLGRYEGGRVLMKRKEVYIDVGPVRERMEEVEEGREASGGH